MVCAVLQFLNAGIKGVHEVVPAQSNAGNSRLLFPVPRNKRLGEGKSLLMPGYGCLDRLHPPAPPAPCEVEARLPLLCEPSTLVTSPCAPQHRISGRQPRQLAGLGCAGGKLCIDILDTAATTWSALLRGNQCLDHGIERGACCPHAGSDMLFSIVFGSASRTSPCGTLRILPPSSIIFCSVV